MKTSKKILLAVLMVVVISSLTVLPSFAWSVTEYPATLSKNTFMGYADPLTSTTQTVNFFFEQNGVQTEALRFPNSASDTEVTFQLYDSTNGNYIVGTLKFPNNQNYMARLYHSGVNGYLSTYFKLVDEDWVLYVQWSGITTPPFDDINSLRVKVTFKPTSDYVFNYLGSYINEYTDTPDGYVNTINDLISQNNALANNNVLDGVFSGIGDGFSSMMTPLLSLSVGGVSLGNVIGVLLIIGAILLFVLLINKLRGAR